MKLFSKVNEYNILLEKVLEKKYFSSDCKNLILSMVYKIENSYNDYYQVKKIDKTKEEFILEIINVIQEFTNNIKLVALGSKEDEILKKNNVLAITEEKSGSIYCYQTEISMLYAISDLKPKYFYISNNQIFKTAFHKMLVYGYNKNNIETLTDFNGWSWDTNLDNINYIYNLIFQNFLILFGNNFLDKWLACDNTNTDFIELIKNRTKKTNYFFWLCRVFYLLEKHNESFVNRLLAKRKEYKDMLNKKKFFETNKENRLKLNKAIIKIDAILNDEELLIREFKKKNSKLEPKKKIRTIKMYKQILEHDKLEFMNKLDEIKSVLKPENYEKKKENLKLYNDILEQRSSLEDALINLQIEFIKCMKLKIPKIKTRDTLTNFIYKIRYYKNLYIKKGIQIKQEDKIVQELEKLEKNIITLACKNSVLKVFSFNVNFNFKIINQILDTKIMDLDQIKVKIDYDKEKLHVQVYDKEVYDKEFYIPLTSGERKELNIRKNRLVNLFV